MTAINLEIPENELTKLNALMLNSAQTAFKQAGEQQKFGEYLNIGEASEYVGVSRKIIKDLIKEGLPVINVTPNLVRIKRTSIDEFLLNKEY